jgi:hypothetical protein
MEIGWPVLYGKVLQKGVYWRTPRKTGWMSEVDEEQEQEPDARGTRTRQQDWEQDWEQE